ncbi:gliding motility protein RemB [Pedobacter sp. P351]|uniref:gliding motility protein RemB n=1 Tax=Pedobacter superstes TaxID=3133441 RepID=UPI0030AFE559
MLIASSHVFSQSRTYTYDYHHYQKINSSLYSLDTNLHTSIRPIFPNDSLQYRLLDSLSSLHNDTSEQRSWIYRKIFTDHLIQVERPDYNVYIDFLPDFQIGRDSERKRATWLNTRGFQVQGNIGKKFRFYSSAYENQGKLPVYLNNFVNSNGVIPGQVNAKFLSNGDKDWAYASALINYTPNKYFSFVLGQDKNFIGDGYRSMILSDVASNYPFFKIETTLGNVRYMNLWAQFQDLKAPVLSHDNGFRKKYGVFHYLDWNINKRLSLGVFESIIWQDADSSGKRGFDLGYLNPIIFLRAIEGYHGSPDNALLGFTGKYKLAKNLTGYGQFILDEFTAKEFFGGSGYWANKFGVQLGIKGFDAFKIRNLNFLTEFNTARPYTYSQRSSLLNYGHYNQALAHPFGANFKEYLAIVDYSYRRFQFFLQGNIAEYGLDPADANFGKDIFKPYTTRNTAKGNYGNQTGQGVKTDFVYFDGRTSFLLNPKTNLRIELGAVFRNEKNSLSYDKTTWLTFGLRSSFRNLYQDF